MGAKLTKMIKIKPISIKAIKTKKKLIVKAAINKKIKNQVVRFKINSKIFKVRTNRNGVAKLVIKKPKKIVNIKATYLKSTVKV